MAQKLKARGHAGRWWATINGKRIPCVHNYWTKNNKYDDDGLFPNVPKHVKFVDEIRSQKKVILCNSALIESLPRGGRFRRKGYISLWDVDNIQFDGRGFRFDFVNQIAEVELG